MLRQVAGFAFRLTGLILGIVGATVSITAIVFSAIGLHKAAVAQSNVKKR